MSRGYWISVNTKDCLDTHGYLVRIWSVEPKPNSRGRYWYEGGELNKGSDLVLGFYIHTLPPGMPAAGFHAKLSGEFDIHATKVERLKCESSHKSAAQLQQEIADLAVQYADSDNLMPDENFFKLVKQYRQAKESASTPQA